MMLHDNAESCCCGRCGAQEYQHIKQQAQVLRPAPARHHCCGVQASRRSVEPTQRCGAMRERLWRALIGGRLAPTIAHNDTDTSVVIAMQQSAVRRMAGSVTCCRCVCMWPMRDLPWHCNPLFAVAPTRAQARPPLPAHPLALPLNR